MKLGRAAPLDARSLLRRKCKRGLAAAAREPIKALSSSHPSNTKIQNTQICTKIHKHKKYKCKRFWFKLPNQTKPQIRRSMAALFRFLYQQRHHQPSLIEIYILHLYSTWTAPFRFQFIRLAD